MTIDESPDGVRPRMVRVDAERQPVRAQCLAPMDGRNRQGTAPAGEVRLLLAAMERGIHWRTALEAVELPTLSKKRDWLTDPGRARFYASLPTAARHRALDVGAGSGVIAQALSEHFDRVVAIEHAAEWSEFMRRRFAQDDVGNVDVVLGSAVPLPFATDTFDLVVVNGVLEWIPEASTGDTPREAQLNFLRDVRRVLRPGGALGIAIENRICLWNLAGAAPHGEPPYAVILPRAVAAWYTRRVQRREYRNWIYTFWGYKRLLRAAGFRDVLIQQVQPNYYAPQEVLDIGWAQEVKRYFQLRRVGGTAAVNLLACLGILGYLAHSFYLQARR
jgi:SAM-dependent methyltransferase